MPGQKKRALNEGDGDGINDNYNQEVDRENFVCTIDISAARRHVQPYYFNHSTYSKGRWWNRPLLDVYTGEYRNYSVDYYREAILAGRIRVNNQRMSPDYIVREGDLLTHRTHRHEPPVLLPVAIKDYQKCTVKDDDDEGNGDGDGDDAERWMFRKLLIIHEDDELVVVNKPASIPVHPSGQYHYNTITCLLSNYYGRSVYVLHRLDKVTSGVLLIAKTMEAAKKYAVLLANHSFRNHDDDDDDDNDDVNVNITNDKKTKKKWVKKEYVCRVEGKFPDGQVRVQMPVTYICRKLGLNMCVRPGHTLGKPSETIFERLAYNGTDSLVKCVPITGRTHQIRVHLRWLGFPIANDRLYRNTVLWGPLPSTADGRISSSNSSSTDSNQTDYYITPELMHERCETFLAGEQISEIDGKSELCSDCGQALRLEQLVEEIWLHARSYSIFDPVTEELRGKFEAPLPVWAQSPSF